MCSFAPGAYQATQIRLKRSLGYARNTPVYRYKCIRRETNKEYLLYDVLTFSIGLWIPMLIIIVVHITMYIRLRQRSRIRAQHSTADTTAEMRRTLKIFVVVVLAFMICTLPNSVIHMIERIHYDYYITHLVEARNFSSHCSIWTAVLTLSSMEKSIAESLKGWNGYGEEYLTSQENV